MASVNDILNNPEALKDFNSLPRNQRAIALGQMDSDYRQLKLKDRFEVLDKLEGHEPESHTVLSEAAKPFKQTASEIARGIDMIRGGLAGTGVAAEKAVTTPGSFKERVQQALQSAAPATKPGYQPQSGEKLGYYAGKYSPELLSLGTGAIEAGAKGAETLGAPTVREAYDSLAETLAKHGVNPGTSEITENTPKAIADYAKNTKDLLKIGMNKGREFLADEETEALNTPSKLERIREDVTRIFNNKWESPNTQVGRDLSQIKETASQRLTDQIPEVKDALKTVKSAYDKEKLLDAITKSAKILGTAAVSGTAIGSGIKLGQKVLGNFGE